MCALHKLKITKAKRVDGDRTLLVCDRCLRAIESREGKMHVEPIDEDEEIITCDWCGEDFEESEMSVIVF